MAWLMLSSLTFEIAMNTVRITTVTATRSLRRLLAPSLLVSVSIESLPMLPDTYYTCRMIEEAAMRMRRLLGIVFAVAGGLFIAPAIAQPLEKFAFGTNWVAQAEHGGFYQALADGTYRRYGLDVTIVQGGPNINNRLLLPVGRIEGFMSANTFQKEPQVLMAHPDQGIEKFEDLKRLTLYISKEGIAGYYQWLKADYGFDEAKVKPYTFNPQPFLADKRAAMQGYVTSEPYAIEKIAGFKPKLFLLADYGFDPYSTLIETRRDLVERKPQLIQRFVDASIIGWY